MATRTETVYAFICDPYGGEHGNKPEITSIYVDEPAGSPAAGTRRARAEWTHVHAAIRITTRGL